LFGLPAERASAHNLSDQPATVAVTAVLHQLKEHMSMPKAYWIATYRAVHNAEALAAYAKLGAPALMKAGGRILARGNPAQVYDNGLNQRTVLLEFDSVEQAIAAHDSAEYQAALKVLGSAADRDLRIVEGIE
jgi:uncharacterized protein (DUF1330 family)